MAIRGDILFEAGYIGVTEGRDDTEAENTPYCPTVGIAIIICYMTYATRDSIARNKLSQ